MGDRMSLQYFGCDYAQNPEYDFPVHEPILEGEITVSEVKHDQQSRSFTLCKNAPTISVFKIERGISIKCL